MNWNPSSIPMAISKAVFSVKFLPRLYSLFRSRERSDVNVGGSYRAIGDPPPMSFSDAANWTFGIMPLFHIAPVSRLADFAQITKPVVQLITINMVDFAIWPTPVNHRKNNSVGLKHQSMDLAPAISRVRNWEGLFASIRRVESTIADILPEKTSSLLVISKEFTANFRRDIGSVSHGAVPLRSGQGRRLFAQLFRPASYARFTLRSQGASV